jgi:predicted alpha-1,2-mannosidase
MKLKLFFPEWKFKTLFLLVFYSTYALSQTTLKPVDYTSYVNPFVGTAGFGHTFPGACVPFGLIQVGPETGNADWKYCAGYQYNDSCVNGFSQTRLNGTGCLDLGDILMQPFTGEPNKGEYKSKIDKTTEIAKPGYYSVFLSSFGVKVEMTASSHVAIHRYQYPKGKSARLMIDFQSNQTGKLSTFQDHVLDAQVSFENENTISGFSHTNSWVERTYYYVITFNKSYRKKTLLPNRNIHERAPRYILDFDLENGEELMVKVSMSSINIDGARKNLNTEIRNWDFENVYQQAKDSWNKELSKIEIVGDKEKKAMFYTSLYRLFIQPNNIADLDQKPYYSTLSLWDTYRAAHPLYTLVSPERVDGMVESLLHQYDKQGFLPIWALWGEETYCMIGNHSVPVIVDAYLKGFKGFDAERAYAAVKSSLTKNHKNSEWDIYMKYGYYPFDLTKIESVSRTLESAYDDYCAAQFAKALGKTEDYNYFTARSAFYKTLFDPTTKLMRAKDSKGNWRTPFNSFSLSHADTSGGDYTEGNAWQYTWHVQHDIPGLIKLMGGQENFVSKLDSLFKFEPTQVGEGVVSDVTGLIGQYAHGNEPSHHVAYLYAVAGKPWRTEELVNEICKTKYISTVDGLCGNDDCGQMSAWYIFSALGFYPVNPCGGEYVIGAPQFQKAVLKLPLGKFFTVEASNFTKENIYVQSIELNGKPYHNRIIMHQDILNGGTLRFKMGSTPSKK